MNQLAVKRDKLHNFFTPLKFFNSNIVLGILIAVVTYGVTLSIVFTAVSPKRYDLKVGDVLQSPIQSPRDVEDKLATLEKIQRAKSNVTPIYRFDQNVSDSMLIKITKIFQNIGEIRGMAEDKLEQWQEERRQEALTNQNIEDDNAVVEGVIDVLPSDIREVYDTEFLKLIKDKLSIELSDEDLITCIESDQRELKVLDEQLNQALDKKLSIGIKEEHVWDVRQSLKESIEGLPISNQVKLLGMAIVGKLDIEPNLLYDAQATENEKEAAANLVEKVIYKKGQHIVQAGQPVTENQIAILKELGFLMDQSADIPLYSGIAITLFVIEALVILYFMYYEKDILNKPLMLAMISLIFCLVLGISYVTSLLHVYLLPSAMLGMLLTILISPRIAMIMNIAISVLLGVALDTQFGVAVTSLAGGMLGIYLSNKPQQRSSLIWAGIGVSIVNIFTIIGFGLISSGGWLQSVKDSLWGIGSGILASVLSVGTLPIWEHLFGVITPIKLLELSNPNHPILKHLLMEAPGTYHHSIIVANLAENAADSIGAKGLLARKRAYYHDIGKLNRPYFFKENQLSSENPHDKLNPTLSTHIITIHPKEGVELAKKYKVPKIIHDFILQHHGTMPVLYFYHKAKNNDNSREVKLEDFRYPGPKPSSREIAIVMMADTVEAAVRSLPEPTPGKVEGLIRKLIKERLDDEQLDECELTLKDLDTIARAFNNVIGGIFHQRVEYPAVNLKEERSNSQDDSGN